MVITDEILHEKLYEAYYDARRHKRNTLAQLNFEIFCEHDLENIYRELVNRTYKPLPPYCFITFDPVQREVYASQFRDRVVQHMLFNMINPLFETLMIYDTYSCRIGKGTLFGVQRYQHHLRSVTDNFKHEAWVLYLDLSGYFMSIDKQLVIDIVMSEIYKHLNRRNPDGNLWGDCIDPDFVLFLLHAFLDHNPALNCIKMGSLSNWIGLPDRKKLECSPDGCGIVIGDITSQLLSNILLNVYDQWVKRHLHIRHYGHYVDDMYHMHPSRSFLLENKPVIESFLKNNLHVTVNPEKWRLLRANYANTYLGAYIRPHYIVPRQRTIDKFVLTMNNLEKHIVIDGLTSYNEIEDTRNIINSYLGLFSHYKSYRLRKEYVERPAFYHYFVFDKDFTKAVIRPEYSGKKQEAWLLDIDDKSSLDLQNLQCMVNIS